MLPEKVCLLPSAGPKDKLDWRELAQCSSKKAREILPYEVAVRLGVLPLGLHYSSGGLLLTVLSANPLNPDSLASLKFISGAEIQTEVSEGAEISQALHAAYLGAQERLVKKALQANDEVLSSSLLSQAPEKFPNPALSQAPVPELLRAILSRAFALDASDIHFEPEQKGLRLRFRIDGFLRTEEQLLGQISVQTAKSLSRHIKVLCALDTSITMLPQEGSFSFEAAESTCRLRVSIIPQLHGEKIVLRFLRNIVLDAAHAPHLTSSYAYLGLTPPQEDLFSCALSSRSGVILLCGPTGSGKSTLLYAALERLAQENLGIAAIEDPIERIIDGVSQTEISPERGLDYSGLLKRLLRQDPDVLMVGEIRDRETAQTALTAGITGCLVLSTIHAGNCLEAPLRLRELGVSDLLLYSSLRLIGSQRLLARNCRRCSAWEKPTEEVSRFFGLDSDEAVAIARGCECCRETGICGRIGAYEFLPMTPQLKAFIRDSRILPEDLYPEALKAGYTPLAYQIRQLLRNAVISPAEAFRVLGISPKFNGTKP
jgi:type II secretory ATPase GspE/PulE/Tfp pilus assembly ATPase PilB-like protein